MAARYGIPGYFDNAEVSGNKIKEPGFLGKTLFVIDGTRIKEPGFGGKTILVIENGKIKEPGFLGRTIFYIDKYGAVKETGLFGRTVGAFPLLPGMGPKGTDVEPIQVEEIRSESFVNKAHRPVDTEPSLDEYAKQLDHEMGYIADIATVRGSGKTISVPTKYNKLTAIAPAIPAEVVKIHSGVLAICPQSIHCLKAYEVEEGNPVFSSENGILYNKDKTMIIRVPTNIEPNAFVFKESVVSIGDSAFASIKNLVSIIIPNRITKIGKRAFEGCFKLKTMTIPKNCSEIGENSFYCDSKLIISTEWEIKPDGWKFEESQIKGIEFGIN